MERWKDISRRSALYLSGGFITVIILHVFMGIFSPVALAAKLGGGGKSSFMSGLISLVVYCFYSYCTQVILQKLDQPNTWLAWIPIANFYAIFKAGDKPGWWCILLIIPLINIIGGILLVTAWIEIVKKLGKSPWLLLLWLIPLVNLFLLPYLAFA
jgi:Family of unknown function (DUF5684)